MMKHLLHLLNPYKEGRRRGRKVGFWLGVRTRVYVGIMHFLKIYYRKYAYNDLIELGSHNIKFVMEKRDHDFEQMLRQMGEDVEPHLAIVQRWPVTSPSKYRWCLFHSCFDYSTVFKLTVNRMEYVIDHTHQMSIRGNVPGILRCSDANDLLMRSAFQIEARTPQKNEASVQQPSTRSTASRSSAQQETVGARNGSGASEEQSPSVIRDKPKRIILNPGGKTNYGNSPQQETTQTMELETEKTRKLQGMEVDESF